jgi:Flp pilus assembly protein CpaB
MTDLMSRPATPPARLPLARWHDGRFLLGLLLVLASVVLGARVTALARDTQQVWSTVRDLPAGATLQAADLALVDVNLGSAASAYIGAAGASPAGRVLDRPMAAGELVAVQAVRGDDLPRRLVTLPVDPLHLPPDLARGERVDVFVTPGADRDGPVQPELVLPGAVVAQIADAVTGLGAGQVGVVVEVDPAQAAASVAALRSGPVDLVRIP